MTREKTTSILITIILVSGCLNQEISSEEVTIYRDIYGVPHIFSESDEGVFYGFGYAQAEDHLEQMLKNYLQATGKMAGVFGEDYVSSDYLVLLLEIPRISKERYKEIPLETRRAIEAFCKGINFYIQKNESPIPGVEEVQPEDVVAWSKLVMLSRPISNLRRNELSEVEGEPPPMDFIPDFYESNEWVVSGSKTKSGNVMLQADPHLPWYGMNQWYEAHLHGESINVAGATLFGFPLIVIGFNENLAWTLTANPPDTSDLYEEKVDVSEMKYLYDGEWKDIRVEKIEIQVMGKTPMKKNLYYTHHGPVIIFNKKEIAYSAKLSTREEVKMIEQMLKMNKAKNLKEFKKALSMQQLVRWNVVYGDVEGNIYYLYNARIGIRDESYDFKKPVPGWIRDTEWKGIYPFEDLPQALNPEVGFFQNCNTSPWYINPKSGIDENYPKYLVTDVFTDRGQRATRLLTERNLLTVEEMMNFSLDTYSMKAEEMMPYLIYSYQKNGEKIQDQNLKKALELLVNWDFVVRMDSTEPLLFLSFLNFFEREIELPEPEKMDEAQQELVKSSLEKGIEEMLKVYQRIGVLWGDVHVMKRGDKIYSLSSGMNLGTLHHAEGERKNGIWYCDRGSSYMLLIELSSPVKAWSLRPLGQSEDENSPHYDDMTRLYSQMKYKPFFFTLEDILSNLESKKVLRFEKPRVVF
ncbi:MAG: penicillin acylase family protein [Candidatus Methanofastidiosia archaeon]